jgi:hypothetical protein
VTVRHEATVVLISGAGGQSLPLRHRVIGGHAKRQIR